MPSRYIYLVEDDPSLRTLVAKVLNGLPLTEIRAYETGEAALSDFADFLPSLLVADLGLPGMSGLEFIARSRQMFSRLPVIVTTGIRSHFDTQLTDFAGLEVWEKPYQIQDLRQRVHNLLPTEMAQKTKAFIPFGVLDYLQLASLGNHDLVLKVSLAEGRSATMEIVGGEIWDCRLGVLKGLEALGEALEHEAQGIDLVPLDQAPRKRRIHDATAQVLLELAVAHDEAHASQG